MYFCQHLILKANHNCGYFYTLMHSGTADEDTPRGAEALSWLDGCRFVAWGE